MKTIRYRRVYFMKLRCMLLAATLVVSMNQAAFAADDINVALSKWGATASSSSEFSGDYSAGNVIDGMWASTDTDKWSANSGWNQTEPHWLIIDLATPRKFHHITIRHEGVAEGGEEFNTSDFRLQCADSPRGEWRDIVPPVKNNRKSITDYEFKPVVARYIRLYITRAEQNGNEYARIYEMEVFSRMADLNAPLAGITLYYPYKRKTADGYEVKAFVEAVIPPSVPKSARVEVRVEGKTVARFETGGLETPAETWLPATEKGKTAALDLMYVTNKSESALNRMTYSVDGPGYFADGMVYIISSSHQDIAWMNSPDICIRDRDLKVISPALKLLRQNPDLRFSVETTLQLMEYLGRHPDSKEEILKLTREGRLEWGATYQQPYESMYPGESLVRQVYLGRKLLKKTLPGCDSHVAWNPDVPGRAMQMPQILAKAGIKYFFISRQDEGLYNWLSPDGTGVVAYTPGHYHESGTVFRAGIAHGADGTTIIQKYKNLDDSAISLSKKLDKNDENYRSRNIPPVFGVIMSSDFTGPAELGSLFTEWSATKSDPASHFTLPGLMNSTSEKYFEAVTRGNPNFETIVGERPDVWLYIHGPTHHKALNACREAGWILPAAETFATVDAVLSGGFGKYPADALDEAWRKAIYADHGWGGKNGHITDRLFKESFEAGRDTGREIFRRSIRSISDRVITRKDAVPVCVFNHLSWKRTGPVECALDMAGALTGNVDIVDGKGTVIPSQVVSGADGPGFKKDEVMKVLFIARDVPAVGYATYYVVPREDSGSGQSASGKLSESPLMENEFYRIELDDHGIRRIVDKEIDEDVFKTGSFSVGDVFTMQSVGNGAGEFADVQQPTMEGFERMSGFTTRWLRTENGPVRTTFETAGTFGHASTVRLRVSLFHGIKRIDFETDILGWNGTRNREFRMAFPLNMEKGDVAYAVPMGVVEVGKSEIRGAAGERYVTACKEVHPREVLDWFSASNGDFGVTISSSVAVFDWKDPTGASGDSPVLQPLLLASRKSCHGEGNWYLQTGDHTYSFSLFSYRGGWKNGWRSGTEASQPMTAVLGGSRKPDGALPESMSFCGIDGDNVSISTIKKCDDDDTVVIRCFELEGKDTQSEITWFGGMTKAEHTNIIEEEGRPISGGGNRFPVSLGHHAIETYKITPVFKK